MRDFHSAFVRTVLPVHDHKSRRSWQWKSLIRSETHPNTDISNRSEEACHFLWKVIIYDGNGLDAAVREEFQEGDGNILEFKWTQGGRVKVGCRRIQPTPVTVTVTCILTRSILLYKTFVIALQITNFITEQQDFFKAYMQTYSCYYCQLIRFKAWKDFQGHMRIRDNP